jgi:hypothetical protein
VNIIRDGRGVVGSILRMEQRKPNKGLLRERLRTTPIIEWPSYLPMFFRTVWRTNVLGKPARYHGSEPPGWREWLDLPRHRSAALQWRAMVEISRRDGAALPAENYMELRYESVIADAGSAIREILRFAELPPDEDLVAWSAEHVQPHRPDMWKETLTAEQQRDVLEIERDLLAELGYVESS